MLTGKEKRSLRAKGNRIRAELWVGKEGISDGTLKTLDNSFNTKELVKIKVHENCPLELTEVAEQLCAGSGAELVQVLGNTLLLHRPLPQKQ